MAECISLGDIDLPVFPLGLSIPQLPRFSFGEVDACCIILIPKIEIRVPLDIPLTPVAEVALALSTEVALAAMEVYFRLKDMIPVCPAE